MWSRKLQKYNKLYVFVISNKGQKYHRMSIYRGRTTTEVYLASVLYDAIDDHDYSSIGTLLTVKKADPNIILPRRGISPLHLAVGSDPPDFALKITSLIMQHGGDPNVQSDEGLTPLHIAAAWNRTEILQLLLNCGGDPEITDNFYKTALHYSVNEGHLKATNIIREFIELQCVSALDNYWDKARCKLTLDKIVINNAGLVGEYELAKEEHNVAIVTEDLNKLPQTNSNEYVLNWCNSQVMTQELYSEESPNQILLTTALSCSVKSCSQLLEFTGTKANASIRCKPCKEQVNLIGKTICHHRETSRESGIATLPDSLTDDKNMKNWSYVLLTTDSDVSIEGTCDLEINKTDLGKPKDTSSDYYTCTEISEDANMFEQNILETSSLSSGNSSCLSEVNSKHNAGNCISISEIYRYSDAEEKIVLFEKRLLMPNALNNQSDSGGSSITKSSKLSSLPRSFDYDTDSLKKELTNFGYIIGPITRSTKRVYLRKLYYLKKHPEIIPPRENNICKKVYSSELEKTLREPKWADDLTVFYKLEAEIIKEFSNTHSTRRWREGLNKSSFTYLLLDPRVTKNLPCRVENLSENEVWGTFLSSIFYVGKGKRSRPYSHLYDAITYFNKGDCNIDSNKIKHILEIWQDNQGVICLHVFQNVIPVEAYTREAAMISALKTDNITNLKTGDFYGVAATWTKHQRNLLGVYLLYKAMKIFLNEGERQLSPHDID